MGHNITSFIDDTLMYSKSLAGCYDCMHDTINVLTNLGFCINEEKSVLTPTKSIEYLGNIIDSDNMIVILPEHRKEKILQHCSSLVKKRKETIKGVARVIGLLVAAFPAVEMGKLHYRTLERAKIEALAKEAGNFNKRMTITDEMKTDLNWWINELATQDRKIFRNVPEVELYMDASTLGWGACLSELTTNSKWSPKEKSLHINALELKAIFFALRSFAHLLGEQHISVV